VRFAVDIGGTFTDLVVEDDDGQLWLTKSPSTPNDPAQGVLDALQRAADDIGISRDELLRKGEQLIHGTTRGINAILTGQTARTAFLTTQGHPDVLVIREGGREKFNLIEEYPEPYVPRSLTFEIPERVGSQGEIVVPLDEAATVQIIKSLPSRGVAAVGVCLLWSIVNPGHERRIGELLEEHLPGVPYTLSHQLNPCLREYRRASSTVIDASLKPVMAVYLENLNGRLRTAGFAGRLLLITSSGGVMDVADIARNPIYLLKSGPALAPVAGRYYGRVDVETDTVLVADTGGTSYDVSLVRRGKIPSTRETWLGPEWTGHITGLPSIDVRSIGAGGGSIAWIDEGGMLHVGPQSAGADPGPACYGKGGTRPTVTDACVVLGYIDPDYFLGGAMPLDVEAAERAVVEDVGRPLGMTAQEAASAIMQVLDEHMVQLIEDLSVNQGVDPREAVLIGGGGAAGLNAVSIARRLGSSQVIIPETGAALSAFGALLSDLSADFATTFVTSSDAFDYKGVNAILADLVGQCNAFAAGPGAGAVDSYIDLSAEMRYPAEVWEIEVPLRVRRFGSPEDVEEMRQDLHAARIEVFGTSDPGAPAHVVTWRARVGCRLREGDPGLLRSSRSLPPANGSRQAYFPRIGLVPTTVRLLHSIAEGEALTGPAIVETPVTTIVVGPGASATRTAAGSLLVTLPTAD
jgi:N-methylhydantoinase A